MPTSIKVAAANCFKEANKNNTAEASMVMTNAPIGTAYCIGKPKPPNAITNDAPKPAAAANPKV